MTTEAPKVRPPCTIDLSSKREVMLHFRDLANMGKLLNMDVMGEITHFRKLCIDAGWSVQNIAKLEQRAYSYTRFEQDLPRLVREKGNWFDYLRDRHRWR